MEKTKKTKKVLLILLAIVVVIQFFRPTKNLSNDQTHDISTVIPVPDNVKQIIKTSCADCHSNFTVYPWYAEVAPVSWYLANHVNEGKEHLNFNEWTTYNKEQQQHLIKGLKKAMKGKWMPLSSYLLIHKNSRMTDEQYTAFYNWVNSIKID